MDSLRTLCDELHRKACDGTLTLQDEASAMELYSSDTDALWRIAEACTYTEFEQVIAEVRAAAANGYVGNALLDRAYRLCTCPEQEREVEQAAWPWREPGETAKLLKPHLWEVDDVDVDVDDDDEVAKFDKKA